jgi:alkylhydroperoxidase family enzyme
MAHVQIPAGDGTEPERLFQLAPHVTSAASALSGAVYSQSTLAPRVRELMRMRIAQINDCSV